MSNAVSLLRLAKVEGESDDDPMIERRIGNPKNVDSVHNSRICYKYLNQTPPGLIIEVYLNEKLKVVSKIMEPILKISLGFWNILICYLTNSAPRDYKEESSRMTFVGITAVLTPDSCFEILIVLPADTLIRKRLSGKELKLAYLESFNHNMFLKQAVPFHLEVMSVLVPGALIPRLQAVQLGRPSPALACIVLVSTFKYFLSLPPPFSKNSLKREEKRKPSIYFVINNVSFLYTSPSFCVPLTQFLIISRLFREFLYVTLRKQSMPYLPFFPIYIHAYSWLHAYPKKANECLTFLSFQF